MAHPVCGIGSTAATQIRGSIVLSILPKYGKYTFSVYTLIHEIYILYSLLVLNGVKKGSPRRDSTLDMTSLIQVAAIRYGNKQQTQL